MKEEQSLISNCPLCGEHSLHCNTRNGSELQQCINCGYVTSDEYIGKKHENEKFKSLTPDMQQWAVEKNDRIWIPSIVTLPIGMIYPDNKPLDELPEEVVKGKESEEFELQWSFAPMVDIPEEERKNFPNQQGGFYKQKIDVADKRDFSTFLEAMVFVNNIVKARKEQDTNESSD
tara:strand:+ start:2286 stop:2810 length:525 start_codon:yes stop_codon:yes gene_type:complete